MTALDKMFDNITLAAAVIAGDRHDLWDSMDGNRDAYPELTAIWKKHGVIEAWYGPLTTFGKELYANRKQFSYEVEMTMLQAKKDKVHASPEQYEVLREALDLHAYSMGPVLFKALSFNHDVPPVVYDIGGGTGGYLKQFSEGFPDWSSCLIDLRPTTPETIVGDAFDPYLWTKLNKTAGMIMVNEVLHLKPSMEWRNLLTPAFQLLAFGGWMMIGERIPTVAFDWRMAAATQFGASVEQQGLEKYIVYRFNLKKKYAVVTNTHYYLFYQKERA